MAKHLDDAIATAGSALMAYGAWMIYPAAGLITGGALLLLAAIFRARADAARGVPK